MLAFQCLSLVEVCMNEVLYLVFSALPNSFPLRKSSVIPIAGAIVLALCAIHLPLTLDWEVLRLFCSLAVGVGSSAAIL